MDPTFKPVGTSPIEVMSYEDFMAAKFDAAPEIVQGVIPGHGLVALAGKPKVGKTSLALDLCAATRTGRPFLGRPTRQVRALFIGEEGGPAEIQQRLYAIGSGAVSAEVPPDAHLGIAMRQRVRLDTRDGIARLDDLIFSANPGLVVLDCLVRMHRLAENDARDMAGLMEALEELASNHQTTILFNHHVAKASEGSSGYTMRGSGVISSSTEANLVLRRTHNRAILTGEMRESAELRLTLEFDEATLQFHQVATAATRGKPSDQRVLEILGIHPGTTIEQIANSLATSDTSLRPIVASLVAAGEVLAFPAPKGRGQVYRLAA